jgi:hypothetical protein
MVARRRQASFELVSNLQKLFVSMLYTNQRYVDPKQVLASVVDDSGDPVKVGQEKDSTEYLLNLIERIEEGLAEESPQATLRVAQSMVAKVPQGIKSEFKFDDEVDALGVPKQSLLDESFF